MLAGEQLWLCTALLEAALLGTQHIAKSWIPRGKMRYLRHDTEALRANSPDFPTIAAVSSGSHAHSGNILATVNVFAS